MTDFQNSTNLRGFPALACGGFPPTQGDEAMSAELIDFTTRLRTLGVDEPPRPRPTGLTTTAKNQRLRRERCEAWRKAEATTEYWDALPLHTRSDARERLRR